MVFYLVISFTVSLETSEFHESMAFFTSFDDFCQCLYSFDEPIIQKATEQAL